MQAHPDTRSEVLVAGFALLLLLTAQWVLSDIIHATNYYGIDGKMAQAAALAALKFAGYFDVTSLSPIQGVGSQLLPKNVWANPAFWPFAVVDKEAATDVSALIALACFATAVYVMVRCFDVPVLPSALAGQACIALFAPALLLVGAPTNFSITPGDAVVYAPYMIALGLLARLQHGSWRAFASVAAAISMLVLYSIYCDPLWTMIAAISWAVPFAVVTLSPLRLNTIITRAAALGCCLALLLFSGAAVYLYTLSQYTARVQFAPALDRERGPALVSAMSYSFTMKYFYIACVLGWLLGLLTLRGRARVLVAVASIAFAAWGLYSIVYLLLLSATWVLPIPMYVEQCLFALYLAGAIAGYWGLLCALVPFIRRLDARLGNLVDAVWQRPGPVSLAAPPLETEPARRALTRRIVTGIPAILVVALIPAKAVTYALTEGRAKATLFYEYDPWPKEPEFERFLTDNVGLSVGQSFRGTVNFLSFDLVTGYTIATAWSRAVPTVNEYSQLVTPEALYFIHVLLKKDVRFDLNRLEMFWSRGSYTPSYWTALAMLGARYAAVLLPLPNQFNPGLTVLTAPHRPTAPYLQPGTWHIYELPGPNVGGYSPTEVMTPTGGADAMAILARPDFDFTKQVVLSAPLDVPLVPASDMRLSIIRGGLHVSGTSAGTSLVVLPQQFSHCLRARDSGVRFVRANLMMAGMVFSGNLDTDILFDYGLLSPGCRRADLGDIKQLDLKIDQRAPHLEGDRLLPDWNGAMSRLRAARAAIK
ncbi:MAG: hypothetical protein ACJ8D9_07750 [Xanthobacteraceae bacterium]